MKLSAGNRHPIRFNSAKFRHKRLFFLCSSPIRFMHNIFAVNLDQALPAHQLV